MTFANWIAQQPNADDIYRNTHLYQQFQLCWLTAQNAMLKSLSVNIGVSPPINIWPGKHEEESE